LVNDDIKDVFDGRSVRVIGWNYLTVCGQTDLQFAAMLLKEKREPAELLCKQ